MAQQITVYRSETKCSHCGRFIRNVVAIDGVEYGVRCAEGFLPRNIQVSVKGKTITKIETSTPEQDEVNAAFEAAKSALGTSRYQRFAGMNVEQLQIMVAAAVARGSEIAPHIELILNYRLKAA